MSSYSAPLRDMRFIREELFDYYGHYRQLTDCTGITPDLVDSIIEGISRFCSTEVAPLSRSGDEQGCRWEDGNVYTPAGFREAYQAYAEAGWNTLDLPAEFGGQGLPESLQTMVSEIVGSSNTAWYMYPGLSHGAIKTIYTHGTQQQQSTFLPNMISGRWTGTMCLTEAHCGTDLGLLRTRAEPSENGNYLIRGTKIFISAGDHDLSDNIIHIVLARLPDAPPGTKGISLFIVPKYKVNTDGSLGEHNQVHCGGIEKKMGIHASATCTLNFDGAEGYLIGPPHKGLACMFTFMNAARLGTAQQGVVHAEVGLQKSLAYSRERLQMRSLSGPKAPELPADPIIVHPDVRRMLLTQKAVAEGGRALIGYAALFLDTLNFSKDETERLYADQMLSFLTPIAKAFLTEMGYESANLALQCFGGHGYIREWGVEQNVRESRISTLYEGTTGIQALDLLGRKVIGSQCRLLQQFIAVVEAFCAEEFDSQQVHDQQKVLRHLIQEWQQLTESIAGQAQNNLEVIGAASVDYLMYSGYIVMGYLWARISAVAHQALTSGSTETTFYRNKLATSRFYFSRLLPRTQTLATTMMAGPDSLAVGEHDIL